jgi:hypothetical protein
MTDSVCGDIIVLERSGYALSPTERAWSEITTRIHLVHFLRAVVYSEVLRAILLSLRIRHVNIDLAPRPRLPSAPAAREPAAQRAQFRAAPAGRLPVVPRRHGTRVCTMVAKRKNGPAERVMSIRKR